jgi:hypothetical protein
MSRERGFPLAHGCSCLFFFQGASGEQRCSCIIIRTSPSRRHDFTELRACLSTDPPFRLIGSPKRWDRNAALTSTLHWFETELLTREENLVGLMAVNRDLSGQAETLHRTERVVLDMDFQREPGTRAAGRQCLQRPLRDDLSTG